MSSIRNILVIVDPTADRHPAVTKAAHLAGAFRARLELFACDTKASRETRLAAHVAAHPGTPCPIDLKPMLEALATPLRDCDIDVMTETQRADPLHAALLDRTRATTADLVVKDTHHHSLARRTFLTNTDWQLIRHCPVPLLLTKSREWSAIPRVLAAVDPGHVNDKPRILDHRILEIAAQFARCLEGELHAVHAYLPLAVVAEAANGAPALAVSPQEMAAERETVRGQVGALARPFEIPDANIHVTLGGPIALLPRWVTQLQADILAMGAISRTGLNRAFVGSTAEDVLESLSCDALIVKPPDFAGALPF